MRFGFCGPSYPAESPNVDAERCINLYPETVEGNGKSAIAMYQTPGLLAFANLGAAPVRGLYEFNDRLFAVNDRFNEVFATGMNAAYSFLPIDANPVYMAANNANQLLICSAGQLWLFPLAAGAIVYHDVPFAITHIQIVDGSPNQDYYITVSLPPTYDAGSSIGFESVPAPLDYLNGEMGSIIGIAGNTVHIRLAQSLTSTWAQSISSITVTPGAAGPTLLPAGTGTAPGGDWANPNNITGNVSYATFNVVIGGAGDSGPLVASNFGFNLPVDAHVRGFEFIFTRKQSQSGHNIAKTGAIFIQKAGLPVGTFKIGTQYYVNSDVVETWGSSTDLWGTTWEYTDTNDAGFGFRWNVAYDLTELSDIISIKNAQVRIYWTVDTSTVAVTLTSPALYSAPNNMAFAGLTHVPALNNNAYPIASIAGAVVTVGPIFTIGSSYSGVETGITDSQLTHYDAASTGNTLGTRTEISTNPVRVADSYGPFTSIDFVDGYFIAQVTNTQEFQISALEDGTTWSGLDVNKLNVYADNIVAMIVTDRNPYFLGPKKTAVYYNSGSANNPFIPIPNALIDQGCAAQSSPVRLDNSIFWIGADERGAGIAWRANGGTPQRVSNHAVEEQWAKFSTITDAIGWTYQEKGHAFWVLYFPAGNATWVYDVATGQWHERNWLNPTDGTTNAHLARCHAYGFQKHLVGSRVDGNIYQLSETTYFDAGNLIQRRRRSPHVALEADYVQVFKLQVDLEVGLGNPVDPGADPQVCLRFSKDGGHTWSNEYWKSAGPMGQYRKRVIWRRLGIARDWVFEITMTDPVPWRIVDAYINDPQPRLADRVRQTA